MHNIFPGIEYVLLTLEVTHLTNSKTSGAHSYIFVATNNGQSHHANKLTKLTA